SGRSLSRSRTAASSGATSDVGSTPLRMTIATDRAGSCTSGRYACSGVSDVMPLNFTSDTTPPTSRQGAKYAPGCVGWSGVSGQPCFSRLPTASSPGHNLRASVSLTTTVFGESGDSVKTVVQPPADQPHPHRLEEPD